MTFSTWLALHFAPRREWDWLWMEIRITPTVEWLLAEVLAGRMTLRQAFALASLSAITVDLCDALSRSSSKMRDAGEALARFNAGLKGRT